MIKYGNHFTCILGKDLQQLNIDTLSGASSSLSDKTTENSGNGNPTPRTMMASSPDICQEAVALATKTDQGITSTPLTVDTYTDKVKLVAL